MCGEENILLLKEGLTGMLSYVEARVNKMRLLFLPYLLCNQRSNRVNSIGVVKHVLFGNRIGTTNLKLPYRFFRVRGFD